jgi:hypothetical protein
MSATPRLQSQQCAVLLNGKRPIASGAHRNFGCFDLTVDRRYMKCGPPICVSNVEKFLVGCEQTECGQITRPGGFKQFRLPWAHKLPALEDTPPSANTSASGSAFAPG